VQLEEPGRQGKQSSSEKKHVYEAGLSAIEVDILERIGILNPKHHVEEELERQPATKIEEMCKQSPPLTS